MIQESLSEGDWLVGTWITFLMDGKVFPFTFSIHLSGCHGYICFQEVCGFFERSLIYDIRLCSWCHTLLSIHFSQPRNLVPPEAIDDVIFFIVSEFMCTFFVLFNVYCRETEVWTLNFTIKPADFLITCRKVITSVQYCTVHLEEGNQWNNSNFIKNTNRFLVRRMEINEQNREL